MTALLGWLNNIVTGALTAGSAAPALPVGNLAVDQGAASMAWQTAAGVTSASAGAWAICFTANNASTWRAFLLARTNLTSAATVRWRVGFGENFFEAGATWTMDATVSPMVTPAGWSFARASLAWYFDATGTLQQAAANAPRQNWDPASHALQGLLIEGAVTNSIRNPRAEGAVAGTPGTAPTYWGPGLVSGVSSQIVGGGSESGVPYCDVRFYGTPSSTGICTFAVEAGPGVAAALGQTWTLSAFLRVTAGSLTNIGAVSLSVTEVASGGGTLTTQTSVVTAPTAAGLATQRMAATYVLGQSSTAFIRPAAQIAVTSGAAIDVTLRIGAPQLEQSGVVSSIVLPTAGSPAASSRAADAASVATAVPAGGYTMFVDATVSAGLTATPVLLGAAGASGFNGATYVSANGSFVTATFLDGAGASQWTSSQLWLNGAATRAVLGWTPAKAEFYVNGVGGTQYAGYTLPAQSVVAIGGGPWSGTPGTAATGTAGIYRKAMFYAGLLSVAQATALSATGSTITDATLVWDSGTVAAGVVPGYGQSLVVAPSDMVGSCCRVDISDPGNPDTFLNIPLAFAGPAWLPAIGPSWATTLGRDDSTAEIVSRGGQEFPVVSWARRHLDAAWEGVRASELWASLMEADRASRTGANLIFAPDISSTALNTEAVFGRLKSTADVGYPAQSASARSWRFRISERL